MPHSLSISLEQGVVVAVVAGEIDLATSTAFIQQTLQRAAEAGTHRILFDMTGIQMPGFRSIAIAHADRAVETGLAHFRIAMLGTADDPVVAYLEMVGINRGISTRSFAARAEALAWLNG